MRCICFGGIWIAAEIRSKWLAVLPCYHKNFWSDLATFPQCSAYWHLAVSYARRMRQDWGFQRETTEKAHENLNTGSQEERKRTVVLLCITEIFT
jgi:hypothetical protein